MHVSSKGCQFPDESAKGVWLAMHVSACSNNEKMRVAVASC